MFAAAIRLTSVSSEHMGIKLREAFLVTDQNSSYFILIASDTFTLSGSRYSAQKLAEKRMQKGVWGLYPGTSNRLVIRAKDQVLIYLGGTGPNRCSVIARAKVGDVECPREAVFIDPINVEGDAADRILHLTDICEIAPVDIRQKLDDLSFIPANRKKWGVALMGGCRKISREDFEKIVCQ